MTRVQRWTAWLRAALTPRRAPTLIHLNRGDGPLCYSRGRRPRKGSGWTTDAEAVTCRRCRAALDVERMHAVAMLADGGDR